MEKYLKKKYEIQDDSSTYSNNNQEDTIKSLREIAELDSIQNPENYKDSNCDDLNIASILNRSIHNSQSKDVNISQIVTCYEEIRKILLSSNKQSEAQLLDLKIDELINELDNHKN